MQNNTKIRQQAILEIIQAGPVFSQDELALRLREEGISSTQATLSRDLKALHILKVPGEGYRLPQSRPVAGNAPHIQSVDFSGQCAVIKTLPGFASAVASFIDHHPCRPVMGTLAGDDTLLLVLREGYSHTQALEALKIALPDIETHPARIMRPPEAGAAIGTFNPS